MSKEQINKEKAELNKHEKQQKKGQGKKEKSETQALNLKNRIDEIARSKNIRTDQELEEFCGLSKASFGKWKNSEPGVFKVLKVANCLDVDISYLITGEPPRRNISPEEAEIINLYNELPPEQQTIHKGQLYESVVAHRGPEKKIKDLILNLLSNKVDEEIIRASATIPDEDFEAIKQEWILSNF